MQCEGSKSVRSSKIMLGERLCTQIERDGNWLHSSKIAYVRGAEPRCKAFHYLSIMLQVELN